MVLEALSMGDVQGTSAPGANAWRTSQKKTLMTPVETKPFLVLRRITEMVRRRLLAGCNAGQGKVGGGRIGREPAL
jgi:hypothetical protein